MELILLAIVVMAVLSACDGRMWSARKPAPRRMPRRVTPRRSPARAPALRPGVAAYSLQGAGRGRSTARWWWE